MSDLIYLLNQLVDLKGNIIIPDVNKDVAPLTDDERASYTDIDFDKVSKHKINVFFPSLFLASLGYFKQFACFSLSVTAKRILLPKDAVGHCQVAFSSVLKQDKVQNLTHEYVFYFFM